MTRHEQVELSFFDGVLHTFEVDVEIASLISTLWACGIKTTHSCQGGDDDYDWMAYVSLLDTPRSRLLVRQMFEPSPRGYDSEREPTFILEFLGASDDRRIVIRVLHEDIKTFTSFVEIETCR